MIIQTLTFHFYFRQTLGNFSKIKLSNLMRKLETPARPAKGDRSAAGVTGEYVVNVYS